jgi:hypothetical protein
VVNDGKPVPVAGDWTRGKLPYSDRPRWLAEAPANPAATPPRVELVGNEKTGQGRAITLRIRSNGAEDVRLFAPEGADIRFAGAAGFVRPIDRSAEEQKYVIDCFGRSCDGAVIKIVTGSAQPVEFTLVGSISGLPPSAGPLLKSRPAVARPQYLPDAMITISRVWL